MALLCSGTGYCSCKLTESPTEFTAAMRKGSSSFARRQRNQPSSTTRCLETLQGYLTHTKIASAKKRQEYHMKHRALTLAPSEAEAIERAKQGDAEAFALLYGLHKRRVYSLCLRMTANSAKAEDLTQEAFLQLFRKIGTFRGESAFSTWLHRMAVNVVLMQLRKKNLPVVPIDETTEGEEEGTIRKELGAPDERLAGSIDRLQLQRAVDELPPGYRTIFVLHDVEGYEHNEIATMVGCSIGNSKSQLHKARMKLRESLKTSRAEKSEKQYWGEMKYELRGV